MAEDKKVDTPSSKDQSSGSDKKDTPTNKADGKVSPSNEDKKPDSVTNQILETNKQILENQKEITGRLTKVEQKSKGKPTDPTGKSKFTLEEPTTDEDNSSMVEQQVEQERELVKVEKGVTKLFRNPDYQKVLENDKTLSKLLDKNPLALLDEMPVDAEDALEKLTLLLDERVKELDSDNEDAKGDDKGGDNPPAPPSSTGTPSQGDSIENILPTQKSVKTVKEVGTSILNTFMRPKS